MDTLDKNMKLKKALFFLTIATTFLYLGWRTFFTLPIHFGVASMIAGILMLVSEALSTLQALDKFSSVRPDAEPDLPVIPESWYPDVDVFIATHNESTEILFKTINGCTFMNYPDKSKIHVFICDDNNRPEMAALAKELKVGYFGLTGNKLLKAGNLNNAMRQTTSPLIITFDADMIPTREMLMKTVPFFFLPQMKKLDDGTWVERKPEEIDPKYKIGFIQTPQSFYNPDLFQYNLYSENRIPNEQDFFFREINVSRNSSNAPIYAGSNTVISRKALEEIDYIATGTITEDFATGLKIQRGGWTTYATSGALAHGLAPDDIESLIKQRVRWGRGCVQSLHHMNILFMKNFPLVSKMSYINCYFYWWSFLARLIFIISPIVFAVFHLRVLICSVEQYLLFWLPYFFLYNLTLKLSAGATRNQHWNGVIDTIIFPYLAGPILKEAMGFKLEKFDVTRKDRSNVKQKPTIFYALPHFLLLISSLAAMAICIKMTLKSASMHNIVMMYWLVINIKNLIIAIFFMWGRQNIRETQRFYVNLPVELKLGGKLVHAKTADISEDGIAMILDYPEYIDPDSDFDLSVSDGPYKAGMKAKVLHIERRNDNTWKYCASISHIDRENIRQYFQIIYDRHHSMPDKIVDNWSLFDDIQLPFNLPSAFHVQAQRKLPRIDLNITALTEDERSCTITSFNYRFLCIRFADEAYDTLKIVFNSNPGMVFHLKHETGITNNLVTNNPVTSNRDHLYRIENWEELMDNASFASLITQWISGTEMKGIISGEQYMYPAEGEIVSNNAGEPAFA